MSVFRYESQRHGGGMNLRQHPKTASTVLEANSFVALASGKLVAATVTTNPKLIMGVVKRGVVATDEDYASQTDLQVDEMITEDDLFVADVSSGTPTKGSFMKIGSTAGSLSAAAATSGQYAPFLVKEVIGGKVVVALIKSVNAA